RIESTGSQAHDFGVEPPGRVVVTKAWSSLKFSCARHLSQRDRNLRDIGFQITFHTERHINCSLSNLINCCGLSTHTFRQCCKNCVLGGNIIRPLRLSTNREQKQAKNKTGFYECAHYFSLRS